MLGASSTLSVFCETKDTIASYLQDCCNSHDRFKQYEVKNYGLTCASLEDYVLQVNSLPLQPGDFVIVVSHCHTSDKLANLEPWHYILAVKDTCTKRGVDFCFFLVPSIERTLNASDRELRFIHNSYEDIVKNICQEYSGATPNSYSYQRVLAKLVADGCPAFDLQPFLNRPHNGGEIYVDKTHFGPTGNKILAESIFYLYLNNKFINTDTVTVKQASIRKVQSFFAPKKEDPSIQAWLRMVKAKNPKAFSNAQRTGCIIMNANPFTNGHRYLVEQAFKKVDCLYIFVVQENLSEFTFEDRFAMVRLGTKDLASRVSVLPGGQFIISSFTFPEYFAKSRLLTESIDSSTDIAIFGSCIAPALNIQYRFVGTEPNCNVTKQYNKTMCYLLPSMGVNVEEIPRCEYEAKPISASMVRRSLAHGEYLEVEQIVPKTSYDYLMAHREQLPR